MFQPAVNLLTEEDESHPFDQAFDDFNYEEQDPYMCSYSEGVQVNNQWLAAATTEIGNKSNSENRTESSVPQISSLINNNYVCDDSLD